MVELPYEQHIVLLRSAEDVVRGGLRVEQTGGFTCREEKRGIEIDPSLVLSPWLMPIAWAIFPVLSYHRPQGLCWTRRPKSKD